ncbi:hypothetical protein BU24DRAFT_289563 [Aaosphaeria arxii CBS 175.79]|uniref:Protein SQS1 n=1 Tax=Aaosphaeria arxii CBS 175.79 TaxID=1450172 RepID=A0A6A5XG47_9PLEO|nr:uncharacterized protein BU24DRAFT_289563 [Aaosphaeria arxii CBS 175.79]KAF2011807.1 hypothetical protein BU24DRAFT_289563 [Aaosphaeria arxii CBS 175.79]
MPRKKPKKGHKGKNNKPRPLPQRSSSNIQTPPAHRSRRDIPHAFSLAEEARFTSGHRTHTFESGTKLRHRPVQFVSAGLLQGTIPQKEFSALPVGLKTVQDTAISLESLSGRHAIKVRGPEPEPEPEHIVAAATASAIAQLSIRSESPQLHGQNSDSSSEDEIVFQGRSAMPAPTISNFAPAPQKETDPNQSRGNSSPKVMSDPDPDEDSVVQTYFNQRLGGQSKWMVGTTPWESRSKPGIGWLPVSDRPEMATFLDDSTTAAMDDYLQNTQEFNVQDSLKASFVRRALDVGQDVPTQESTDGEQGSSADEANSIAENIDELNEWDSDLIRDLGDISTSYSSVSSEPIRRIVSKRARKSGLQYLVVYDGHTLDDARWIPARLVKTPRELELVEIFESSHMERYRSNVSASGSDSESLSLGASDWDDDEDEGDDDNDDDDDNAFEDAGLSPSVIGDGDMDDEHIARILQKQEELGLGSDDIVLFGHDDVHGAAVASMNDSHHREASWKRPYSKSKRPQRGFPVASAMAEMLEQDPYDGFDIMDTERPSLRPRKKGRRGQMPPELSDSDLNSQMQAAWEKDRATKRLKKAEREELRKQGLLGRKGRAENPNDKYLDFNEVTEEIREFMFSKMQTLSLPPMEAKRRAVIHQFVHQLGLSSRSRGDGANRFTVLSKTLRTRRIDDEEFDDIVGQRRFKTRLQSATPRPPRSNAKGRAIVSYRDGDTVGASAPELGPDNKGRRLLEKMGWTQGTALGALENKGILQPITHTVKMTRAGLK